jgi:ATP-binding cassette subfamily C protein
MKLKPQAIDPRGFARALFRWSPGSFLLVVALMVALGLTEGAGFLLLVPLLGLVGVPVEGEAPEAVLGAIEGLFGALGLRLELVPILLVFLGVVAVRTLLQWWSAVRSAGLQRGFALHLQQRLYRSILQARWKLLVRMKISELSHALTVDVTRVSYSTNLLTRGFAEVVVNAIFLAFAFYLEPWVTLFAISLGFMLLTLGRGWNLRFQSLGDDLTVAGRAVHAAVQDHLGALKVAKSYGAEGRSMDNFDRETERMMGALVDVDRGYASASGWMTVAAAIILGVLVFGAIEVLALSAATLLLLVVIFSRVVPRVIALQRAWYSLLNTLPGYGNVLAMIRVCEALSEGSTEGDRWPPCEEEIRLDEVTFRHEESAIDATLNKVSLSIPAKKTTAIIGPSGAGKTTVADLVLGLLAPDAGEVLVDGIPLESDFAAGWRRQIGYVPQDGTLLPDSVRVNLLWANPDASEDDMWEALKQAEAEKFVKNLPNGLDSVVGDRGALLSGGERQRLTLAGALIRKPTLLILDEATSALDPMNERKILDTIQGLSGQLTVLVISHRESAVRDADLIHVMEDGRVVMSGTWAETLQEV